VAIPLVSVGAHPSDGSLGSALHWLRATPGQQTTGQSRFGSIRVQAGSKIPKIARQARPRAADAEMTRSASHVDECYHEFAASRVFRAYERVVGLVESSNGFVAFSMRADENGSVILTGDDLEYLPPEVTSWCSLVLIGEYTPPFGNDADLIENPQGLFAAFYEEPSAAPNRVRRRAPPAYQDKGYLAYGDAVSSTLTTFGDTWHFRGVAGDRVYIFMASDKFDTYLELYHETPQLVLLWQDDDSGGDYDAYIYYFELPATASYTIIARGFNNERGAYSLSLEKMAEPPERPVLPLAATRPANMPEADQTPSLWEGVRYTDLMSPGVQTYSLTTGLERRRWTFTWCAIDEATLEQIARPLTLTFYINNVQVDPNLFLVYAISSGCRAWSTFLDGWSGGEQYTLDIRYHLSQSINDGWNSYPAGDYVQRMIVSVQ
jgi:hypothetical protein